MNKLLVVGALTIHSPENGAVYAQGESKIISFTVTDDIDIRSIAYFNKDLGTGSVAGTEFLGDQNCKFVSNIIQISNLTL